MTNEQRIRIEKRIVKSIVKTALKAGYSVSVNNGGDENEISKSTDAKKILAATHQTDEEHILLHKNKKTSWVFLVYGNDGYDVINDYTVDLEEPLAPVFKLADEIEMKCV